MGENTGVIPPNLRKMIDEAPINSEFYGFFRVCPLTHERPRWMQFVCLMTASKVFIRPHN
jgi:hypothetical protein